MKKAVLKTFTFNSGRGYTEIGQVINVIVFEQVADPDFEGAAYATVWIHDTARNLYLDMEMWMIDASEPTNSDAIMRHYDSGSKSVLSPSDWDVMWAQHGVKDSLEACA